MTDHEIRLVKIRLEYEKDPEVRDRLYNSIRGTKKQLLATLTTQENTNEPRNSQAH